MWEKEERTPILYTFGEEKKICFDTDHSQSNTKQFIPLPPEVEWIEHQGPRLQFDHLVRWFHSLVCSMLCIWYTGWVQRVKMWWWHFRSPKKWTQISLRHRNKTLILSVLSHKEPYFTGSCAPIILHCKNSYGTLAESAGLFSLI